MRDEELIKSLIEFFKAGKVYYKSGEIIEFRITKIEDLTDKVITFFDKYKILGSKSEDYSDFKKISELLKNKKHLTSEGLNLIRKIKLQQEINKGRKKLVSGLF